jgi:hypothetical protein
MKAFWTTSERKRSLEPVMPEKSASPTLNGADIPGTIELNLVRKFILT